MHQELLRTATSTILAWPLGGHEKTATDAAATALSMAEAGGVLGGVSPMLRERLRDVVRAMSVFVQSPDGNGTGTGGHGRAWGQTPHFKRMPGRTAADSVRLAKDSLWNAADGAVFLFRGGDTASAKGMLGQALHALQDSFSPAVVKRVPDEQGRLVIRDLTEDSAPGPSQQGAGGGIGPDSGLGRATVLASAVLLAYFIQRCLGREGDAALLRQSLDDTYLLEQAS